MKSPEFVIHGTSSETNAKDIENDRFKAEEGRATVSCDLIYAYFDWTKDKSKRSGSKSTTEVTDQEKGRMIIMEVPQDKSVNLATHTDIMIDAENKKISGYSSKYESGRRQLAIYNEGNIKEKRKIIELAKTELEPWTRQQEELLLSHGINPKEKLSREQLIQKTNTMAVEKQIAFIEALDEIERKKIIPKQVAENPIDIPKENIVMSIIPSPEIDTVLSKLNTEIKTLQTINFNQYKKELLAAIKKNNENYIAPNANPDTIIEMLLISTVETEIINLARGLAMDAKRAQGYEIYNRGKKREKQINEESLKKKIETIQSRVNSPEFDMGKRNVNLYIRSAIEKIFRDIKNDKKED